MKAMTKIRNDYFFLQNIKVECESDEPSNNIAEISAFQAGMPNKASPKYGSPSPNPFGDHDYYAFSDDDGGPTVKDEPWSPSMSPPQKNFNDADIPSLEYGMFNYSFHTKMD